MDKFFDVWPDDGDVSDSFDTYKEAEEFAKNLIEHRKTDTADIYEHRKVSTVSLGPVVVTKHK